MPPYSTQEERDALALYINEVLPTFADDFYHDYERNRLRVGIASSEGVFVALTRFALCEYFRGLNLKGYRRSSTTLWKVHDAWTAVRFAGDVDFVVAPGCRHQQSEHIKVTMTTPGQQKMLVEVFRWNNGQRGAIYRVEGLLSKRTDSSGEEWGLVAPFA